MNIEIFILVLIGLVAGGITLFKSIQSASSLSCCRTCSGQCNKREQNKRLS